jgi:hypothetical protein
MEEKIALINQMKTQHFVMVSTIRGKTNNTTMFEQLHNLISTRRMPLVEQELPTLPEHMSSPPVFSGVRVTRSLVIKNKTYHTV